MNDLVSGSTARGVLDAPSVFAPRPLGSRVLSHRPQKGEVLGSFVLRLAADYRAAQVVPLLMFAFGPVEVNQEFIRLFRQAYGPVDWPLQWVEGRPCDESCMAGVQTFALDSLNDSLQRLVHQGRVVGTVYEDTQARHCLLGGLGEYQEGLAQGLQTEATFHVLRDCLAQAGLSLADIARTWFYNERILEWYPEFNAVRNRFYGEHPFRVGSLPASTAVAGRNVRGSALQLAVWASKPLSGQPEVVRELASPLQCPAPAYGSAFSRAIRLGSGAARRVMVSGTASIEPGGKTVWTGDVRRQIALSMQVVSAILKEESLGLEECTRAIAYFKSPAYLEHFVAYLSAEGLERMPYLAVHCDICRDDLLFEIELDAAPRSVS